MIVSTVVRSLNTGMTTESNGLGGTDRLETAALMGTENVAYAPSAGNAPSLDKTSQAAPTAISGVKKLLILAPNWLGDAVLALPAIDDVRRAAAGATIAIGARRSVAPLFELVSSVDKVVVLRGKGDAGALREHSFEVALLLPNSFHAAFTVWRAGISERWGYRTDFRGPLLTRAHTPPADVHQGAYYQHLVGLLGIPIGPLEPRLNVGEEARRAGRDALASRGWNRRGPLVAIAPGAAYGPAKRWPAASFAGVIRGLTKDGTTAVLIGSEADRPAGDEVLAPLGPEAGVIDLIGRTDFATLAGVLTNCRVLVSNDSGAMHFAAALGLPVTAIFGPTNEQATYPLGSRHVVLTHHVWCRPCMLRECPLNHGCMRGIAVEHVLAAVRSS
jgi:heptosyltransferase-2